MAQFIKMTWMSFWRMLILSAISGEIHLFYIFVISLVVAGVIRFGFKKTVPTFPIINLFRHKKIFRNLNGEYDTDKKTVNQDTTPYANRVTVEHASEQGVITGYEPVSLNSVSIPDPKFVSHMRGVPGSGLDSATHMGAGNIKSGQIGESNFAKALSVTNMSGANQGVMDNRSIINNVNSFWSVAMPSENDVSQRDKYDTDIDCILVANDKIILVDTKFYKSGNVTYKSHEEMIYCEDNTNGNLVGNPHRMTKNMKMAERRFKKHFPDMNISSVVVLMPTDAGSPQIDNVYWPGTIKAVDINTAILKAVQLTQNNNNGQNYDALRKIAMLVKN